ncbi:metaxin-1a isoform X1 [Leuresthes tenuis]|uniref:metaxin-1a isoform X1 n=1 Tax=Leuresthes tenuis TaxID=355514 RepID=UPI003B5144F1
MAAPDELFCWEGDWGLPSVSTDCLVVLAYAQFAGAPLKLRKICNTWRSPSGSLPALRTNQKETLSRPSDIIIHLRKQKYNADYDLSAKEGADSLAFISLLEEKLMPALIYTFWIEPKNYVDVTRRWYAEHMPFPLNFFMPARMQGRRLEKLRLLRGDESLEAGEELEKELYRDAVECMNLLSQRLGSQKFFFGDSNLQSEGVPTGRRWRLRQRAQQAAEAAAVRAGGSGRHAELRPGDRHGVHSARPAGGAGGAAGPGGHRIPRGRRRRLRGAVPGLHGQQWKYSAPGVIGRFYLAKKGRFELFITLKVIPGHGCELWTGAGVCKKLIKVNSLDVFVE